MLVCKSYITYCSKRTKERRANKDESDFDRFSITGLGVESGIGKAGVHLRRPNHPGGTG